MATGVVLAVWLDHVQQPARCLAARRGANTADQPVKSFGIGAYGLVLFALVVGALLLLDRKAWRDSVETSPAQVRTDE